MAHAGSIFLSALARRSRNRSRPPPFARLVLGIGRGMRARGTDQRIDRRGISRGHHLYLSAAHAQSHTPAAPAADIERAGFTGDCGALAHPCRIAQSARRAGQRIFLVLFRQRAFQALFGHALSQRLRHRSPAAFLGIAANMAAALERVPAAGAGANSFSYSRMEERARLRSTRSRELAVWHLGAADFSFLQLFHPAGVLRCSHFSGARALERRVVGTRIRIVCY